MSVLEYVADLEWNSVRRNFERLDTLFGIQKSTDARGFSILGVTLRFGTQVVTWPGGAQQSNGPTVTHGVGKAPVVVLLTPIGGLSAGSAFAVPVSATLGATTFIVTAKTHDESSPVLGTTSTLSWVAIG